MILVYCLDTSALIEAWVRLYSPDVFPTYWVKLEGAIQRKILISVDNVLDEIKMKDDDLQKWAKQQNDLFLPIDEDVQSKVGEIMTAFPKFVDTRPKNMADPFVIALAKVKKAVVVTEEKRPGTEKRPTIPFVCNKLQIKYIPILDMIRELEWSF